jgi:hypothetical protein
VSDLEGHANEAEVFETRIALLSAAVFQLVKKSETQRKLSIVLLLWTSSIIKF